MATVFKDGNVTVSLEGDLEKFAVEAVDRLLPRVRQEMETEVGYVLSDAVNPEWPIKTGRSKRGMEQITQITPDSVSVEIRNTVPYVYYVRPKAWFGTETAWNRLVKKPMRAVARELMRRFGYQILQQAAKRGGG